MAIKVVTDSTSDLTLEMSKEHGVTIVPTSIIFGQRQYLDREELSPEEFYDKLANDSAHPTTAAPSIGQFMEAYESIGGDADGIVSIHASSKLSGTHNAAVQASREADVSCPIRVIDSLQASLGLGLAAISAAKAAAAGGDLDAVAATAGGAAARAQVIALFDTLEYLQRGGRIGAAKALLGSILRFKPMIIITDGEVKPLARARTYAKGLARLEQVARGVGPLVDLGVMYSTDADMGAEVAGRMSDALPDGVKPTIVQLGPSIGAHLGPDAVGVVTVRAE